MQLFYNRNFGAEQVLDEADSKHCVKVLRKRPGDEIWVTDGLGSMFQCQIEEANAKCTKLQILQELENYEAPSRRIHLAVVLTKNIDRVMYLVEKATEIGLSELSFIVSTNVERKTLRTDRIERVAIAAMKQSLKAFLPQINEPVPLSDFVLNCTDGQKFIAHLHRDAQSLAGQHFVESLCLLVGPEGDFTAEEVQLAQKNDFVLVSLGNSRLRTETAGLVGVSLMNLL